MDTFAVNLQEMTQMGFFDVVFDDNNDEDLLIATKAAIMDGSIIAGNGNEYGENGDADNIATMQANDGPSAPSNFAIITHEDSTDGASTSKQPQFVDFSEDDKENFLLKMRNKNTVRKTESSLKQFQRWLAEPPRNERRLMWHIMPTELDNYIGSFLLSIRKADGSEYEPDTLTSYHRGLDRCLREKQYLYSLTTDKEFSTSRAILAAKRKELKEKGKGNRPNAAEPLSSDEHSILKEKGVLGTDCPLKLLNTVWLNNSILFGIRGGTESHNLRWGDVKLRKTDAGREYLEYNERLTKTRTCETTSEQRAFRPKQFAHETTENCPVHAFKEFARHRPESMLEPESPFYLSINYTRRPGSDVWYKAMAMGENTLRSLMKKMALKGQLQGKKTNHSARKTTCTKLLHSGVAPTIIQQLTGHRNVQSINNYAKASIQMQENMSDILSDNTAATLQNKQVALSNNALTFVSSSTGCTTQNPPVVSATTLSANNNPQFNLTQNMQKNTMSEMVNTSNSMFGQILQNARLMNCQITINNERSPKQKRKRIRVIDSDSE